MLKSINEFSELLKNRKFRILNKNLNEVINNYNFFHISEKIDQESPSSKNIIRNFKESKVIIINQSEEEDLFIIGFKRTILIIKKSSLFLLDDFFSENERLKICFLSRKDDFFIKENKYLMHYEETFIDIKEINEFGIHLITSNSNLKPIFSCISVFLIKSSYLNIKQNRLDYFNSNENEENERPLKILELNDDNFIFLRHIGFGTSFRVDLVYHIKREKLFAKKIQHLMSEEVEKLIWREIENYKSIHHPFLPKFYGWNKQENFFIIEFIKGETLDNIKNLNLNENDKITIIFELLIIFEYLHRSHFIYRDLKPNNLIIDDDKTIVLIDFDRMINSKTIFDEKLITTDFQSIFTAREIKSSNFSYEKSDIYSIGMMINFILNGEKSGSIKIDDLNEMYKKCTNKIPEKRPSIYQLIFDLYLNHYSQIKIHNFFRRNKEYLKSSYDEEIIELMIKIELNSNDPNTLYSIGLVFSDGKYVTRDNDKAHKYFLAAAKQNHQASMLIINSSYQPGYFEITDIKNSIECLTNSAKQNHLMAIHTLGIIYFENKYVQKDINKSIYYFNLAAEQNLQESNVQLALIFLSFNNINKGIEYLNKAADRNLPSALFYLGEIYFNKEYGLQDINKAFDFYHRASKVNSIEAQFKLGVIYYNGEYVQPDFDKSIYYFTLAADQGFSLAQYQLGLIYYNKDRNTNSDFQNLATEMNYIKANFKQSTILYTSKYESPYIDKAIYYFTLAADNGVLLAQYQLGLIYDNKDINKAIHYYELAAKQNFAEAQYQLGLLYEKGEKVTRDLNKAIKYYKQASSSNADAYFRLGFIYEYSLIDYNKAIENYTQAANKNHSIAQLNLGNIYYTGRYNMHDIQKAIFYYTLSANQDNVNAQHNLGEIYAEGEYVRKDFKKAIYYFELAAKKNFVESIFRLFCIYAQQNDIPRAVNYLYSAAKFNDARAQFNLGVMYHEGRYVKRDINLAIYYYELAINQNYERAIYNLANIYLHGENGIIDINKAIYYLTSIENNSRAQFILGLVYFEDQFGRYDINKAIYYFTKSANANYSRSQYMLGIIYSSNDYDKFDIHKAIYYLTRSSNLNFEQAQFKLGMIYIEGEFIPKNIKKGISLIELASINNNIMANFVLGVIYHEGKLIKRDIRKAIEYYKEGSSFNNQYAKNNLAVIFREFDNINYSIALFREAINQNDDILAGYNLAHIYLYGDCFKEDIDEAIKLIISPTKKGFNSAKMLISLALIKKVGFDICDIRNEIEKYCRSVEIINKVCFFIKKENLNCERVFSELYNFYRQVVLIYNHLNKITYSFKLKEEKHPKKEIKVVDINSQFYDGFGHDLMKYP